MCAKRFRSGTLRVCCVGRASRVPPWLGPGDPPVVPGNGGAALVVYERDVNPGVMNLAFQDIQYASIMSSCRHNWPRSLKALVLRSVIPRDAQLRSRNHARVQTDRKPNTRGPVNWMDCMDRVDQQKQSQTIRVVGLSSVLIYRLRSAVDSLRRAGRVRVSTIPKSQMPPRLLQGRVSGAR